jgi:hypothetical protein
LAISTDAPGISSLDLRGGQPTSLLSPTVVTNGGRSSSAISAKGPKIENILFLYQITRSLR